MSEQTRILFVCLGNIVRSPLAENLFKHMAEEAGVEQKYEVDSAGTGAYHVGESPDERMREVAAKKGLVYDGRARQVHPKDFERFDYLVAMDTSNRDSLLRMTYVKGQEAKVMLMREFDTENVFEESVPDPYYGGIEGFENTYEIVERSVRGLLDALESGELN